MNLRTSVTDWKEGKVYRFQFVLAVQREKQRAKKKPRFLAAFLKFFFLFLRRAVFNAAPQLTKSLEEAKFALVNDVAILWERGGGGREAYSTFVLRLKVAI